MEDTDRRAIAAAELQAAIAACEFYTKRLNGTSNHVRAMADRLVALVGRLTNAFVADLEANTQEK